MKADWEMESLTGSSFLRKKLCTMEGNTHLWGAAACL